MTETFTFYDPSEALESKEAIEVFLADAFETGDTAYIAKALGVVATAKGMTQLAENANLSREHLYRSLSEQGNPTLKTLMAVMKAFHLNLSVKRI